MVIDNGLAGVKVSTSEITTVDPELGLCFRGYPMAQMVEQCEFEEAAYLIHYKKLPTAQELKDFKKQLHQMRFLPPALKTFLKAIPGSAQPMDVHRETTGIMGSLEPESKQNTPQLIATRLLAVQLPSLAYWYHVSKTGEEIDIRTEEGDSVALNFLKLIFKTKEVPKEKVAALNAYMIGLLDNDITAGSFAVRIAASTIQDLHSSLIAGITVGKGQLHGGALDTVCKFIKQFKSPDAAEAYVIKMLEKKQLVFGFGHRKYKKEDPRSRVFKPYGKLLSELPSGDKKFQAVLERIEEVMMREKGIPTNGDIHLMVLPYQIGIPEGLNTTVCCCARMHGLIGHALEQRQRKKLISPVGEYNGPAPRNLVPIAMRKEFEQVPRL